MNSWSKLSLSLVVLTLLWSQALAGPRLDDVDGPPAEPEAGTKKKEEKKDFPDFSEVVTKEFKVIDLAYKPDDNSKPFYTLHYNAKTDELLAEIPANQLDADFMLSSSIHAGPGIAGWMWGDQILRWQRRDKKLLLIEPDLLNEGKSGTAVSDAVRRTYTDRVVKVLPIKTINKGNLVIDLGDLFKQDFGNIGRVYGGALDASLAKWLRTKCFEQNLVLTVESPFKGTGSSFLGGNAYDGTLIAVNYNLSSIPKTGYTPRAADDRIGYFTTVRRDWAKGYQERTLFNRYVNRWHLEKQDPALDQSPVKEPIIFYIEKTVPVRFRSAVRDGILEWNKAFEICGYLNAVQVRQQTETNEFKDYDPEDVTKNFFRWTTTGVGIAVGPSRANPLTGEIYDADIVFDDGWVRGPIETHAVFGAKALAAWTGDAKLSAFLEAHPEFSFTPRSERLLPGYGDDVTEIKTLQPNLDLLADRYARYMCDCGASVRHELGMAGTVFAAQGCSEIPDQFLQQVVKEVVMHEVGHTLGLRHNFKASSWLPLEDVLSNADDQRPISASVMDYNAFMFNTKQKLQGDFAMTTLGPYDMWAIEYGYRPLSKDFKTEEEMLKSVTARVAEAGLDYATDEDTGLFQPDPLVNRRDMGSDPLEYARYRVELVETLFNNIADWAVDDGDSYSVLRRRFDRLLSEVAFSSMFAGRYIGGQYFHRDHKGDPNARVPFVLTSAEKQREAMRFLADKVFSGRVLSFKPEVLTRMAPGRWGHWGSPDFDPFIEYSLHDRVDMVMHTALLPVFNPFTISRVHDMEMMVEEGQPAYTLAEHVRTLTDTIWSELEKPLTKAYSDRDPMVNSIRRALQRAYTRQMTAYVVMPAGWFVPADANALMRMTCERLHDKIAAVSDDKNLDDVSRAHLLDVQRRMSKALNAQQIQD